MLKWLLFLIPMMSLASETLTVVAVGEADTEADGIHFEFDLDTSKETALDQKKIKGFREIFASDFDFYRSRFKVESGAKEKARYQVLVAGSRAGKTFNVTLTLTDKPENKQLLQETLPLDFNKLRDSGHEMTDKIYQAIEGKPSIFKTQIYFVSDRTSQGNQVKKELYRMDFDGANKERLTYFNSIIISPSLSRDNKQIVYTLLEDKIKKTTQQEGVQAIKNLNLHLMDLGSRKSRLISNIDGINSGAVFNKNGDSLYLTLSYQKNADIYKVNLKSKKKQRVTSHFLDDVDPHINDDESLLTFLSGRAGKAMIYTLDPSGKEKSVKRISFVGRFNAAPRFNPDGTEIVFSSWLDNRFDLFRIGSDGKNLVRLTKNFGSNEEPWFSPDGQFIVFTSQRVISRKKATQDVYIMDRDGEIIRKISEGYGKIYTPRWSNL